MFTDHFQLEYQPFTEKISVSRIIRDDRINQAMARLQYLSLNGNVALITGQTGVGKSTLIQLFVDSLPQKQFFPIYIHFTHIRSSGIFHLIVNELGEEPKRAKERLFLQLMEKAKKINLTPIIIIDLC